MNKNEQSIETLMEELSEEALKELSNGQEEGE